MPETTMQVKLLSMTKNPTAVIFAACRQCYSADYAGDIYDTAIEDDASARKQEDFVRRIIKSGHESPLEHVSFVFAIEGVSRVLTHQLVRHRVASYSQQSQRYVGKHSGKTGKVMMFVNAHENLAPRLNELSEENQEQQEQKRKTI